MDLSRVLPYADAVLLAWYPGEQGGSALADILFGKMSPSGHLPVTFYQSLDQLPAYRDYSMKERTYRYFHGPVQFPFGFGLSYSNCRYSWSQKPQATYKENDSVAFSILLDNKSSYDLSELLQAYIQYPDLPRMPIKELKAFKKTLVPLGTKRIIRLSIPVRELKKWDEKSHSWKLVKGNYNLFIGKNANEDILSASFDIQ